MRFRFYQILLTAFLLTGITAGAQKISGTWEGIMGWQPYTEINKQFLQLNIVQQGDELCGYTYDTLISRKGDYCKALFKGRYNKKTKSWTLYGTSFLETKDDHRLMQMELWRDKHMGKDKLVARIFNDEEEDDSLWLIAGSDKLLQLSDMTSIGSPGPGSEIILLKMVSETANPLPDSIPSCFSNDQPAVSKKTPMPKIDAPIISAILPSRKNNIIARLPVSVKHIQIDLYDNAIVDGDTISILYNGKMMVARQQLSEKPITVEWDLDLTASGHEIILMAENLGSIPPNTALIVVRAGDKRYELRASASLQENAVLVFEYNPAK